MNTFRQWLATQMEMSLMRAEAYQIQLYFMENLFLLGIEIGRKRRLSESERIVFQKTYSTAQALVSIGKCTGSAKFEREFRYEVSRVVEDWLKGEPTIRENIEWLIRMPLDKFNGDEIPANLRMTLKKEMKELAASSGELLSDDQIEEIIQKLEKPLDRA